MAKGALGAAAWGEAVDRAAGAVRDRLPVELQRPLVGIVLGSGLSLLSEHIVGRHEVPYADIPGMPQVSVLGHAGSFHFGVLGGVPVACASGRVHLYEGYEPSEVVFGVRLLAALGAGTVLLTNAAGGIAGHLAPGSLLAISDHINLTGKNPLVGPNEHGPRFVDMTEAYDGELRRLAARVAREQGIELTEGVYAGLLGPSYETPAEIRMLERLGAAAVGMSTVLETLALRHQSVRVLGLSCITNLAAGKSGQPLSHTEVAEVAARSGAAFCRLVIGILSALQQAQ